MEVKQSRKKAISLFGLFLKYIAIFCMNTALIFVFAFVLFLGAQTQGWVLPANFTENRLTENTPAIKKAARVEEALIPEGCTYGVYDRDGGWQAGSFEEEERTKAWTHYENNNIYGGSGEYYRFIFMDNGNICVVKYQLTMSYAVSRLSTVLPPPDVLMLFTDALLFLLNAILLSGKFTAVLKRQLNRLSEVTEKIAENDLEFETALCDIKEINEVMVSFGKMKDALQDSLKKQWDMEKQREDQLSALAHDIKTPLTVIRGNAELLQEADGAEENQSYTAYILQNVKEIEQYMESMRQVLGGGERDGGEGIGGEESFSFQELEKILSEAVKQIAVAWRFPVAFEQKPNASADRRVRCCRERILRAWKNIVGNAARYTDSSRGLKIVMEERVREGIRYFTATVRDYGPGFTGKDLQYADQEFYSGDASRHDRSHQGLGLTIAGRFLEEQGGFLEFGNACEGEGAEAALWLKADDICKDS